MHQANREAVFAWLDALQFGKAELLQKVLDPHGASGSILETVKKQNKECERFFTVLLFYAQEEDFYDDGKRGFRNHRHQRAHPSLL